MKKKMRLTSQRLSELKQPGTQYVIRCPGKDCWTEGYWTCNTGFFSHYLRALFGIRLATRYKVPYYVDYGHVPHVYSDVSIFPSELNFWSYYFQSPNQELLGSTKKLVSYSYETHPVRIWNRHFLTEMNQLAQKHLVLHPQIEKIVTSRKEDFKQERVLGIHIRRTDHSKEIEPVSLKTYKQVIRSHLKYFNKVFVATDDHRVLDEMREDFGERLLFNKVKRSRNNEAVHSFPSANGFQLGLDALTDVYSLSFCHKLILAHSNLSYTALLLNPTISYVLLETRKHKLRRWKTLDAYHVDQFATQLPI